MKEDPARHFSRAATSAGTRVLSEGSGMTRLQLSEVRLAANEATGINSNNGEAFIYVLAGQGTLTQGGEQIDIGAGDFIGLSAGDETVLHNPFDPDLVYLSGGEKT